MKTKDVRPWWWWINPWLYIKRRDVAYDWALDELYATNVALWRLQNLCREAELVPKLPGHYSSAQEKIVMLSKLCDSCGKMYAVRQSRETTEVKE